MPAGKYFFRLTDSKVPAYGPMILGIEIDNADSVDLWMVVRGNEPQTANWGSPLGKGTGGVWTMQACELWDSKYEFSGGDKNRGGSRRGLLMCPAPTSQLIDIPPCVFKDDFSKERQAVYLLRQSAMVMSFVA